MTDNAGYRPTDDSALRWEDCHCTKCGQPDKKCECVALTPGTKPTVSSNPIAYNERYRRTRPVMYGDIEQLFMALGVIDDYLLWLNVVQGWTLPGNGSAVRLQVADARAIARALYGAGPDEVTAPETGEQPWMGAVDRLLEKIGHVPGIEAERKALLAFMPSPTAQKASDGRS